MCTVTEQYSTGMGNLVNIVANYDTQVSEYQVNVNIYSCILTSDNAIKQRDRYISGIQTNGSENFFQFSTRTDGSIRLEYIVQPNGVLPQWLIHMGLATSLSEALQKVKWYGGGSEENYPDRKSGYPIGVHTTTVRDIYEPYLIPQDYGLCTDNRWLEVSDKDGDGLRIKSDYLFNFNIYPLTTNSLTKAMYTHQLEESKGNALNIDYYTSDVGCTARSIFRSCKTPVTKYERTILITPLKK